MEDQEKERAEETGKEKPRSGSQQPDWLQQVQNWSWEPEILTSGGSLVTLYFVLNEVWYLESWIMFHFELTPLIASIISSALISILGVLFITFLVHIGVRIAWIAFVGLSYVYPEGGDKEEAGHMGIVHDSLGFQHPTRLVLKLENLSSRLFSLPLIVFGMIAFMLIGFILPCALVYYFFGWTATWVFFLIYLIVSILLEQTSLKRKAWVKRFGQIRSDYTLYFLVENVFFTATAKRNRSKAGKVLPIIGMIIVLSFGGIIVGKKSSELEGTFVPEEHDEEGLIYHDKNEYQETRDPAKYVERSELPAFHLDKPYLKSFIAYYEFDEKVRDLLSERDTAKDEIEPSKLYQVRIDSQKVDGVRWAWSHHEATGQLGIKAVIPLEGIEEGHHKFKLSKKSWDHQKDSIVHYEDWDVIPFWVERS